MFENRCSKMIPLPPLGPARVSSFPAHWAVQVSFYRARSVLSSACVDRCFGLAFTEKLELPVSIVSVLVSLGRDDSSAPFYIVCCQVVFSFPVLTSFKWPPVAFGSWGLTWRGMASCSSGRRCLKAEAEPCRPERVAGELSVLSKGPAKKRLECSFVFPLVHFAWRLGL